MPFLVFVIPTLIFAVLALRLKEPIRGRWERQATGASQEVVDTEEAKPSFAESWRTVHKVRSLHRIWWSLPFLATSFIGFVSLGHCSTRRSSGSMSEAAGSRRRSPNRSRSSVS